MTNYTPPVDQLLALGDVRGKRGWEDYAALGLRAEHVPDLIRMATDDELNHGHPESAEVWAPLHAWRALGQLRAEAAAEPLTHLFHLIDDNDDDWISGELPQVVGMIGPAAIPPVAAYVADTTHGQGARAAAADCLGEIGQQHVDARAECVALLTRELERFQENTPEWNAFLIAPLLDLRAVESAPVMEKAFAARRVELIVVGDWEDVQVTLGLRQQRDTPRPNYFAQWLSPARSGRKVFHKAKRRDKRQSPQPRSKKHRK